MKVLHILLVGSGLNREITFDNAYLSLNNGQSRVYTCGKSEIEGSFESRMIAAWWLSEEKGDKE